MAEIPYTLSSQVEGSDRPAGTVSVTWPNLASGDNGQPYPGHSYADRSAQVSGTFSAATCKITGSNNGTNYVPLTNPQGDDVSLTAAGLKAVSEISRYVRPEVTGGDGATSLTVTLIARR